MKTIVKHASKAQNIALEIVADAHWSAIDFGTEFRRGYIQDSFEVKTSKVSRAVEIEVREILAKFGYTF